jgi:hypothetical protein
MALLFPRDVFKAKGARHFASKLCLSQEAYDKALAAGYFATVPEALAPDPVVTIVEPETPLSRAELEAEAKRLGVKLDSRNSDERLAERIMEAHAALPSEG